MPIETGKSPTQTSSAYPVLDAIESQSPSAVSTPGRSEATSSPAIRALQEQYDQLRSEIQGLRAGAEGEAPPSYVESHMIDAAGTQSLG